MVDRQLNIPLGMELRLINTKNIFPLGVYTPLIEREKYQYLLVNKDLPSIMFLTIGTSKQSAFFTYQDSIPLYNSHGIYAHGKTPLETLSNYNSLIEM